MAYLEEVYENKKKIIKLLINNAEIVKTINNTNIETPDDLINNNIYHDLYIPDVQSEAKVYICIGIYVTNVTGKLYKDADIHFWVFAHQDIMDTGLGYTRVDYIQSQIDKMMNGNYNLGLDAALLKSSRPFIPNIKFHGVEMIYRVPDFNQDDRNGDVDGKRQ